MYNDEELNNGSAEKKTENTSENEYHYTYSYSGNSSSDNKAENTANTQQTQNNAYQTYSSPYSQQYNYSNQNAYQPNMNGYGQNNAYAPVGNQNMNTRPKKKSSAGTIALLLVACILVSGLAGFGGALVANKLAGNKNNNNTNNPAASSGDNVVYKTIDSGKNDGTITSGSNAIANVAKVASDSVVEIVTEAVQKSSFFGDYVTSGAGSGVIFTNTGYIITCAHVVNGATTITVKLTNGMSYDAKLIGEDSVTDIAVIKIEAESLTPCIIGDSSKLVVGDDAIAIGNPLGELGGTVTNGIISALDRKVQIDGQDYNVLQTNAAINPGNSGGGLFNINAQLIGIVNAKSAGDSIEGLGFAIPINSAMDIAQQLMQYGYVKGRPMLGVYVQEITDTTFYWSLRNTEYAALINYITDYGVYFTEYNTEAGQVEGDLQFGDRIIALDGISVSKLSDISALLNNEYKVGDTIKLTVARMTNIKSARTEMVEVEITLIENTNK